MTIPNVAPDPLVGMAVPRIRLLVTGSRAWPDPTYIANVLDDLTLDFLDVTIVHGKCDPQTPSGRVIPWDDAAAMPPGAELWGADWHAHQHALRRKWFPEPHPADWEFYGVQAGPRRNRAMVKLGADLCVGFPLGNSAGTRGCLKLAIAARIPIVSREGELVLPGFAGRGAF